MARAVGIDLGTTNSVVAVLEGGEPTVIANAGETISPGADPGVLHCVFFNVQPVNVIVTLPVFGPLISPASVLAAQITRFPPMPRSRVGPLVDVNGFPNGALNSGSAA